jgi:hypothetical protein
MQVAREVGLDTPRALIKNNSQVREVNRVAVF